MSTKTDLTPTQTTLGELYAWIHQRAEYLRKQKTAASQVSEATDTAANTTPASEPERLQDSTDEE